MRILISIITLLFVIPNSLKAQTYNEEFTKILKAAIDDKGIDAGVKAFWEYKKDSKNQDKDIGPTTGKLAWSYMKEQKVDVALTLFETMAKAYPERWRPWYYQGEVYRMIGQPEKSGKFYEEALSRDQNNAQVKEKIALIESKE